jgi:NDP-sugar pyrophosphorylase family protein
LRDSGNFLVHNVDVDSDINIPRVYDYHTKQNALAVLCVKKRETARQLLIDRNNNLIGRVKDGNSEFYKESTDCSETAFCGVYVLSARVFDLFPQMINST